MIWWIVAGLVVPGVGLLLLTVWVCRIAGAASAVVWSVARKSSPARRRRRLADAGFRPTRRKVDERPAEGAP